jgi:recombination protein RecR
MLQSLEQLVTALSRLPTIGKKTAWRLALHLVERPTSEVENLAECLRAVKHSIVTCRRCFNFSEGELCTVCSSTSRDTSLVCVVEKPMDVFTIENSGRYRGLYHVLGGVLSPINGITADKLHIADLIRRVDEEKPSELILGLGGSADAEATSHYIAKILHSRPVRVTRLARGLPAGMELEYVDQVTLMQSLAERTDVRQVASSQHSAVSGQRAQP